MAPRSTHNGQPRSGPSASCGRCSRKARWRSSPSTRGKVAYPLYPIAFLFGSSLSADPLLNQTPLAAKYDVDRSGYIAEIAVDRGHRGRGGGQRLIEPYLTLCRKRALLDVLVRTNDTDQHLHRFYCSIGFTKLGTTARQELPTGGVVKRYFHRSVRSG